MTSAGSWLGRGRDMAKSTVSGSQAEVVRGDGQFAGVSYLPAPEGTPVAGAVLVATGNGAQTAWSTSVLMDETGGVIS